MKKKFPNKIRKSRKPQKLIIAVGKTSMNVYIVGEDLLRVFYKLFCLWFCVSSNQWENTVAKILQGMWERFLYENNCNCNSYKFSYKSVFIPFLSNQRQESNFEKVGDLMTRNISVFCLQQLNSKDLKKDFLTLFLLVLQLHCNALWIDQVSISHLLDPSKYKILKNLCF